MTIFMHERGKKCPDCEGSGVSGWFVDCETCDGEGYVDEPRQPTAPPLPSHQQGTENG